MKSQLATKSRIFLAEDHLMMRDGLGIVADAGADMECCGDAGDLSNALIKIRALQPDLGISSVGELHPAAVHRMMEDG